MAEEENQGPALVIKKRTKPRGQTKSSRSLASEAVQDAVSNEDDHEGSAVVRRSVKSVKSRTNSKLSFAGDQQPKVEKAISRPAIAVPNSDHDAVSSQSAAARSHSSYSSADLDALRASTRSASELTQAKFGHLPYSQADQEMIPTENAVAAAKMKRDMLRRTGQTDFIALDGSAESQEVILAGDKGGESRLMREEDELGEGDEGLFLSCRQPVRVD